MQRRQRRSVKFWQENCPQYEEQSDVAFEQHFKGLLEKKKPSLQTLQKTVKNIQVQLKAFNQQSHIYMVESSDEEQQMTQPQKKYTINFKCSSKNIQLTQSQPISPQNIINKSQSHQKKDSIKLFAAQGRNSLQVQNPSTAVNLSLLSKKDMNKQRSLKIKFISKTDNCLKPIKKPFQNSHNPSQNKRRNRTKPLSNVVPFTVKKDLQRKENRKCLSKDRDSIMNKLKRINEQCYGLQSKRTSIKKSIQRFMKYSGDFETQLTKKMIRIHKINYL